MSLSQLGPGDSSPGIFKGFYPRGNDVLFGLDSSDLRHALLILVCPTAAFAGERDRDPT